MDAVASRRLIEAAQALVPADRALLNIWIHHGLDDPALARLTGTSPGAIASRRDGIVTGLASTLGLPPEHVRDAIEELARSERVATENGSAPPAERPSNAVSNEAPEASGEASRGLLPPLPSHASGRGDGDRRRGRFTRVAAAALASIALLSVLIVLLSAGSDSRRSAGPKPPRPSPAQVGHRQAFSALAGGPAGVTGSVAYFGAPPHLRLVMTVSGLPPVGGDHYELWLYNSIIDSVPLSELGSAAGQLTVTLPAGYRRFRWLDISRQPAGAAHHSGESVLRIATGP